MSLILQSPMLRCKVERAEAPILGREKARVKRVKIERQFARKTQQSCTANCRMKPKAKSSRVKAKGCDSEQSKPRSGFARDPKKHFRFQVSFIDAVVGKRWKPCFGSLGHGFIGVCPTGSGRKGRPRQADMQAARLPKQASIVIFVRSPAASLQERGGRIIGGYEESLNVDAQTLNWSGQRGDIRNTRMQTIVNHCNSGGRVVVGVREGSTRDFQLLGELTHIADMEGARFLVENGTAVLNEQGSSRMHKAISAVCLSDTLRKGVGLAIAHHPSTTQGAYWCRSCCYLPPRAVLHFRELKQEGIQAFQHVRSEKRKLPALVADNGEPAAKCPAMRLHGKQPFVKAEGRLSQSFEDTIVAAVSSPSDVTRSRPEQDHAMDPAPGYPVDARHIPRRRWKRDVWRHRVLDLPGQSSSAPAMLFLNHGGVCMDAAATPSTVDAVLPAGHAVGEFLSSRDASLSTTGDLALVPSPDRDVDNDASSSYEVSPSLVVQSSTHAFLPLASSAGLTGISALPRPMESSFPSSVFGHFVMESSFSQVTSLVQAVVQAGDVIAEKSSPVDTSLPPSADLELSSLLDSNANDRDSRSCAASSSSADAGVSSSTDTLLPAVDNAALRGNSALLSSKESAILCSANGDMISDAAEAAPFCNVSVQAGGTAAELLPPGDATLPLLAGLALSLSPDPQGIDGTSRDHLAAMSSSMDAPSSTDEVLPSADFAHLRCNSAMPSSQVSAFPCTADLLVPSSQGTEHSTWWSKYCWPKTFRL